MDFKYENNKQNKKILERFKKWMLSSGISMKTIDKHVQNADFFINEYLTYYEVKPAEEGWAYINDFLGDWFIRKVAWSTEYTINENITSLKKFYKFLTEINMITENDYQEFLEVIKKKRKEWIKSVNKIVMFEDDYYIEEDDEYDLFVLRELFNNIKGFNQIKPWQWLGDTDLFAIKLHDEDEAFFCCVLGNAGKEFGLIVYIGVSGLESYFKLLDQDYDYVEEAINVMNAYKIDYCDRNELLDEDYELVKLAGVTFKGKKQWPAISVYEPGYAARIIDSEGVAVLNRILKAANEYVLYLKDNMDKASLMQEGKICVREYAADNIYTEKILDYRDIDKITDTNVRIPISYNELEVRKLKKACRSLNEVWEIDFFHHIAAVKENEEYYFPAILMIAEVDSQLIIGHRLSHPYSFEEEFQQYLLMLIDNIKVIPRKVVLKNNYLYQILIDLLDNLGISVEHVEKLKVIPFIKKDFFTFFNQDKMKE